MADNARRIARREPLIRKSIGFLDGLSLAIQCTENVIEQNAYYNGWLCDTTISNILAFDSFGKIIFAILNSPGSWHDAMVARPLYDFFRRNPQLLFSLIADSAFPRNKEFQKVILKPIKKFPRRGLARRMVTRKHRAIVSLRQAAEWGMRSLQATFSRLKTRLPSNAFQRSLIVECCCYLHNFRVDTMGISQINTVFSPHYEECVRDFTYDRIARYYNVNDN